MIKQRALFIIYSLLYYWQHNNIHVFDVHLPVSVFKLTLYKVEIT